MIALHPEYVIDNSDKKKAVILPYDEWELLLAEIEELEDVLIFDKVKANNNDEIIFFEQAIEEIKEDMR